MEGRVEEKVEEKVEETVEGDVEGETRPSAWRVARRRVAHRVHESEARAALVGAPVGEKHGRGATAEEAVGEQHRAVVAAVPGSRYARA